MSEKIFYVVYPGSEKLDLGKRRPVTITINKKTAELDVEKYREYGEVVPVIASKLDKIVEEMKNE